MYINIDISLQNAQRTMIKLLINILSKSSKDIKEWQKEWHKFFTDNEKNLTPYENLWLIFDTAVSSVDFFREKNDVIIENLKSVRNSIPNEKNHQLLKDKIRQLQSTSNKLSEEITDLKKTRIFRTHQNNLNEKLNTISKSIKDKNKSFKNEEKRFHREAANIIKQNIKAELKSNLSMKEQFTDFVKSFDIYPDEFKEALAQCDPKKDLSQWKENILQKNPEQSFESSDEEEDDDEQKINWYLKSVKSRFIENESSDEETNQRLKSVKSRSSANVNIHRKIGQPLKSVKFRSSANVNIHRKIGQPPKSVKSRSIENENSDKKKPIRRPSLRSSSVVDKYCDKKIKSSQELSEEYFLSTD
ncbi:unnamed protein product [Rotaria sordida]|uniref:Uncharacterized protein n=1 Tax=Rotaria sordida TaxID=392033 RepID=A0A820EPJ2_9BILA|nr:unnamed protein product [Rotaria sordida]